MLLILVCVLLQLLLVLLMLMLLMLMMRLLLMHYGYASYRATTSCAQNAIYEHPAVHADMP